VSQALCGLGWAFASGADVAWITDELDRADLIDRVLVAQGRGELVGSALGIVGFGLLGWATSLSLAIVVSGCWMISVGIVIVGRWPESRHPGHEVPRAAPVAVVRDSIAIARADRIIALVLASTLLVNGGAEGFGRLFERRLIALGMPSAPEPIVWFAVLALVAAALGAAVLRIVEARIAGVGVASRAYVAACGIAAFGLVVFAHAPNAASAVAGALLVRGLGFPTVRVAATIMVNRRTPSASRATVHSMLSQAENLGEIVCGIGLAITAAASATITLVASAALVAAAGAVVTVGLRGTAGGYAKGRPIRRPGSGGRRKEERS
jgi:hypothetical protein